MAESGPKSTEKYRKMADDDQRMTKNDQKWPKMHLNWSKMGRKWTENGKRSPTMAENGRQWAEKYRKVPKMADNDQRMTEMAENGQSLILGPNGAAKSHFAPILGPLGCQCTFLGFKNVDSGLRSTVFA